MASPQSLSDSSEQSTGRDRDKRLSLALPSAGTMLGLSALIALCVGRYPIAPPRVFATFLTALHVGTPPPDAALLHSIVIASRLPRVLAAALVGAAISASGGVYQTVFRNPLVSPGILGILSGAACGAALAIVMGLTGPWVQVLAFGGGIASVGVGLGVAAIIGGEGVIQLVLGGMVCNAIFTSLLSLIKYVADPVDHLPAIVYWLLGSLAQVGWTELRPLALPLLLGTVALCLAGRFIDALALSDDEARSLGVPVTRLRFAVVCVATLLSALTVSLAGIIGWVGLLVPHIARSLVGPSNRRLIPLSALLGAIGIIFADTLARSLFPGEIPLGILTEMFGALASVLVLRRLRTGNI